MRHRYDVISTGLIAICAAFLTGLALAMLCIVMIMGFDRPAGVLPEIELEETERVITTRPPATMEAHRPARIYTRYRDWVAFRNLVTNDVARHGGWSEQHGESTGQMRHHVPAEYMARLEPMLATSGEKPCSSAYETWAKTALAEARQPAPRPALVDTIVEIKYDVPLAGREAGRWAIRGLLGAICGLLTAGAASAIAGAWAKARHDRARRPVHQT